MRALIGLLVVSFIAFAAPAGAADDVAAAQGIIRSQEQALGHDDAATAYSHAAPAIQGIFPDAETFMAMVRRSYAPVYRHKSFEFGEARVSDGKIAQQVHIVDADGELWEALTAGRQREDRRVCSGEGRRPRGVTVVRTS